jgi:hypothetical protein
MLVFSPCLHQKTQPWLVLGIRSILVALGVGREVEVPEEIEGGLLEEVPEVALPEIEVH